VDIGFQSFYARPHTVFLFYERKRTYLSNTLQDRIVEFDDGSEILDAFLYLDSTSGYFELGEIGWRVK